jgi:hypothetical protein
MPDMRAAMEIVEARSDEYVAALWATVPKQEGPTGPSVTFTDIVRTAIVGRDAALMPTRGDFRRFPWPDSESFATYMITVWFLDRAYFRFALEQFPVASLFGPDPVVVTEDFLNRLSVAAAQFLAGYHQEDPEKRAQAATFAALAIKESMWGGPLPEEWL